MEQKRKYRKTSSIIYITLLKKKRTFFSSVYSSSMLNLTDLCKNDREDEIIKKRKENETDFCKYSS